MPKPIVADPNGTASVLNMEAIGALGRGDTALAQLKRKEAGEILEQRMKAVSRAREKHYLRFLAATQFYKGGHYQRAAELAGKIDPKLLDARARELLPPFLADVRERSSPGYIARQRRIIDDLWTARDWDGVLATLAEHPYATVPTAVACIRGMACLHLGKPAAAAHFLGIAYRDPNLERRYLDTTIAFPIKWAFAGRLADAQEFLARLSNSVQAPSVSASIATVAFAHFLVAKGDSKRQPAATVLHNAAEGWSSYQRLPADRQDNLSTRQAVAISLAAAACCAQ